ncbi:MAG: hypothetical protein WCS96_01775 [Victivallales bacterium]
MKIKVHFSSREAISRLTLQNQAHQRQLPPFGSLLRRNPVRFSMGRESRAKIMDNSSWE